MLLDLRHMFAHSLHVVVKVEQIQGVIADPCWKFLCDLCPAVSCHTVSSTAVHGSKHADIEPIHDKRSAMHTGYVPKYCSPTSPPQLSQLHACEAWVAAYGFLLPWLTLPPMYCWAVFAWQGSVAAEA